MPWILKPDALRQARETQKLTRSDAERATGLSRWAIHRHETPMLAPAWVYDETALRYAEAYRVKREDIAQWVDSATEPTAPDREIETQSGTYEVVRPALEKHCRVAIALFAGRKYAVVGRVREFKGVPPQVSSALNAPASETAAFRVRCDQARALPFSVTVLARGEHATQLIGAADAQTPTASIIEVVPAPAGVDFPTFARRPTARPYAFVVREVAQAKTGS